MHGKDFFAVGHMDESLIQHLLGVMHKYNLQCINNILGNFGNILAVLLRKQHRCYLSALATAVMSEIPADGPSFGTAPSGT